MKNWNVPAINELDVRLTASSGQPSTVEAAGYMQNGWHPATYDSAVYERGGPDCVIPVKDSVQS